MSPADPETVSLADGAGDTANSVVADPAGEDSGRRLLALIAELVAELRPGHPPTPRLDSRLERDLGLDSLARVELLARIERVFGIHLGDDSLVSAETVRDLLRALSGGAPDALPMVAEHCRHEVLPGLEDGFPGTAATLGEVLVWHAQRHPDRPHVLFRNGDAPPRGFSYGELLASARAVAAGLRQRRVRPGDFVAIMLPTGLEFFQSFYGILLAGGVPVPIYPPTRPGQIEDHLRRQAGILQNCEAVALLSFDAARVVAHILSGLVPSLQFVATPEALRKTGEAQSAEADHAASPGEIAFLQYTSGSTGSPKGVTLDHGSLLANIRAWGQAIALSPADVVVSWLPLYHDMGLIGAWLGSLYHACPLVLMSPLDFLARPERWLWAIHVHRGTVTAAPNFAFELCLRHAKPSKLTGLDLSSWRYAANGAEPVSADTLARFAATFRPHGFRADALAPVYGLAECSVGLAVSPPGRGVLIEHLDRAVLAEGVAVAAKEGDIEAIKLVACGIPLPGHELRIVDEAGNELPPRQVGRIEFRGPSATRGYYRNAEATARLVRDGWLDSGDIGFIAGEDIFISGRAKDTIIRGGRNLYPYELEQAIGGIDGIRRGCVAVFGALDKASGTERLVAVAECRAVGYEVRRGLVDRINGLSLDLLGTPLDDVVLAPPQAVLKTSSGKIRRAATRDAYLSGELGQAGQAPWRQLFRLASAGLGKRLQRGGDWIAGGWGWTVCALLAAPAGAALLLPDPRWRWYLVSRLAAFGLKLAGIHIDASGSPADSSRRVVYVANHASYLDVFVLISVLPDPVGFVAKQELGGHRLLATILQRLGTLFVDRFDARQGLDDLRRIGRELQSRSLLVFAEGTFTARPGLRAFRMGAFQLATENRAPVLPVALSGTRAVLRDGSWLPRRGRITVRFASPLLPAGSDWSAAVALHHAARAFIVEHCGESDLGAS